MIKWMFLGIVITAVMILGLIAYNPLEQAEAAPGVNVIKIKNPGGFQALSRIDERINVIICRPAGCTVTGPVTNVDATHWTVNAGAGNGFDDVYIFDTRTTAAFPAAAVWLIDWTTADDDKFVVTAKGVITLIVDDGGGLDDYNAKGINVIDFDDDVTDGGDLVNIKP